MCGARCATHSSSCPNELTAVRSCTHRAKEFFFFLSIVWQYKGRVEKGRGNENTLSCLESNVKRVFRNRPVKAARRHKRPCGRSGGGGGGGSLIAARGLNQCWWCVSLLMCDGHNVIIFNVFRVCASLLFFISFPLYFAFSKSVRRPFPLLRVLAWHCNIA